jgi:cytochrome c biogenesis factor
MYPIILSIHNIFRWVVLVMGIVVIVRAYVGWFGKRQWSERDRKVGSFYSIALDIQVLLGLLLYFFLSPLTQSAFQDLSAAMSSGNLRFFLLEHPLYMILAVILAHLGNILSKKATEDNKRFRRAALWFSLSLVAILLGMPWTSRIFPGF